MVKGKKKQEYVVVEKFTGSRGWLWFWILVFFPAAILYYFTNRSPTRVKIIV